MHCTLDLVSFIVIANAAPVRRSSPNRRSVVKNSQPTMRTNKGTSVRTQSLSFSIMNDETEIIPLIPTHRRRNLQQNKDKAKEPVTTAVVATPSPVVTTRKPVPPTRRPTTTQPPTTTMPTGQPTRDPNATRKPSNAPSLFPTRVIDATTNVFNVTATTLPTATPTMMSTLMPTARTTMEVTTALPTAIAESETIANRLDIPIPEIMNLLPANVSVPIALSLSFGHHHRAFDRNSTVQESVQTVLSQFLCRNTDVMLIRRDTSDSAWHLACTSRSRHVVRLLANDTIDSDIRTVLMNPPQLSIDTLMFVENTTQCSVWTFLYPVISIGPVFVEMAFEIDPSLEGFELANAALESLRDSVQSALDGSIVDGDFDQQLQTALDTKNVRSSPIGQELTIFAKASLSPQPLDEASGNISNVSSNPWGVLRLSGIVLVLFSVLSYVLLLKGSARRRQRIMREEQKNEERPVLKSPDVVDSFLDACALQNPPDDATLPEPLQPLTPGMPPRIRSIN
jgi:hypothetical protein